MKDSVLTFSEKLFEQFCDDNKIVYKKIKEGRERRPDYIMELKGESVAVEVKQFELNEEEKRIKKQFEERGWTDAHGDVPGRRVRKMISEAAGQLREYAKTRPTILVLYNKDPLFFRNVEPLNIFYGMFGLEGVNVAVPKDIKEKPYVLGHELISNKTLRIDSYTEFSALAVMHNFTEVIDFFVYHNPYAQISFVSNLLVGDSVRHFIPDFAALNWKRI